MAARKSRKNALARQCMRYLQHGDEEFAIRNFVEDAAFEPSEPFGHDHLSALDLRKQRLGAVVVADVCLRDEHFAWVMAEFERLAIDKVCHSICFHVPRCEEDKMCSVEHRDDTTLACLNAEHSLQHLDVSAPKKDQTHERTAGAGDEERENYTPQYRQPIK